MKLTIPLYAAPLLAAFAYSPVSLAQFPACQSASSDSDNDGWGWENNRTCLVDNSAASTATTQNLNTQSVTTTNSGFPVCTSSAADEDGDGWGYEFNRSCRVTVATQTAAPATSVTTTPATSSQDIQNGLYLGPFAPTALQIWITMAGKIFSSLTEREEKLITEIFSRK